MDQVWMSRAKYILLTSRSGGLTTVCICFQSPSANGGWSDLMLALHPDSDFASFQVRWLYPIWHSSYLACKVMPISVSASKVHGCVAAFLVIYLRCKIKIHTMGPH